MIRSWLSPQEILLLRRLDAAGCPLDRSYLARPIYPVGVEGVELPDLEANLLPMPDGTGIILPIRIVATADLKITRFDLQGDWLQEKVTWVTLKQFCRQSFAISGTKSWQVKFSALEHRGFSLKGGTATAGALFGITRSRPRAVGMVLPVTLLVAVPLNEYPFTLNLRNPYQYRRPVQRSGAAAVKSSRAGDELGDQVVESVVAERTNVGASVPPPGSEAASNEPHTKAT